jgi:UDP-N-acetylglucosamine 4,6-dehydratase
MNIQRINEIYDLIDNKNILITGGTGSFGKKMTDVLLKKFKPNKLIIFSRDEFKQSVMQQTFSPIKYPCLRYFIGNIRDPQRLEYAFKDVDIIFHAAALKQVPTLEYNPTEAIKTNIYGAENVIHAAIKCNVKKVVALSTDKSVNPVNLYGATKMCFERLFIAANNLSGKNGTQFSVVRYGNVFGSRGSVVPIFLEQKKSSILTITNPKMTRFTLTVDDAINFILTATSYMIGGEIFIPKLPSYSIMQLANVIAPNSKKKIIGIRPGEKVEECLIGSGESYLTLDCGQFYIVTPFIRLIINENYEEHYKDLNPTKLEPNYVYSSSDNELIDGALLKKLVDQFYQSNI